MLGNAFAVLGVTPRTPLADLFGLADTPDAAGAARALSVPRSRLAAEASFLPGAADAAPAILDSLRAGRRVDPAGLPSLAAANLRAHLCATGLATAEDLAGLAQAMPTGADEALVAMIDADRAVAGVPPCQPAALGMEVEALTEAHAAALVTACIAGDDPAGQLAALVCAGPGRPSPILRRAASAWTRRTASELAGRQAAADAAAAAWRRRPDADTLLAVEETVRRWAALSRPQRLVDARAALDHPPTVRALAPWRQAIRHVAPAGQDAALSAARLLATVFDDLPGEGASLLQEVRALAGLAEAQALAPHLERLGELVARLSADPALLRAGLATRPFGPTARKDAGALWVAFDAAAAASRVSDAAWDAVTPLARLLDIPNRVGGAKAAATLFAGLLARAEAEGRTDLAARLRADLRAHQAAAALQVYARRTRKRWLPWWLAPLRRRGVLAAIDRALLVVDDPGERRRLEAQRASMRGRGRLAWLIAGLVLGVAGVCAGVGELDDEYAATAPYRRHAPISLASQASLPASAPQPPRPAPAFPVRTGEHPPDPGGRTLTAAELRWCLANGARLRAATRAAKPDEQAGLDGLGTQLDQRCDGRTARRLDRDAVQADVDANRDRLRSEGDAMLGAPPK